MNSDDAYRREVEKRLQELEKTAREISEHIELLKVLLADSTSQKDLEAISVETSRVEVSPPNCLRYFGYLRFVSGDKAIPDECLTCQKLIECSKHIE